ncbi:MAG: WecB/TagA/CpsF family glycosyltransferase [Bacteroidota bacterium]
METLKTVKIECYNIFASTLDTISVKSNEKSIINTINAHSYIVAKKDLEFRKALIESDVLLPDGEGITFMAKILKKLKISKIAGADIHDYLLRISEEKGLKCFYLGSSESTLEKIKAKHGEKYSNIEFNFFSPPFKSVFSPADNQLMIDKINSIHPDVLFVGMTAPKQEKWVHENKEKINAKIICSIGAVFDFVAETKKRAPNWIIKNKLEWLYRSFTAWRLTKRYMYSTPLFLVELFRLKFFAKKNDK